MPISAEQERILLNRYHLTTLYPTEWPQEQDDDDDDDDDDDENDAFHKPDKSTTKDTSSARPKSVVIQKLNRHASLNSSLRSGSSSKTSRPGKDASVQKDEPDALGMAPSVAGELRKRGLPVEEDLSLRNRFMLSSTTFNPALYLAHVHQHASTADLLRGLDFLSKSIEQKSASLKILVESNFERFVRAKATIDSVYTEMRTHGIEELPASSQTPSLSPSIGTGSSTMRPHSRHASRTQSHFRNTSGAFGSQSRVTLQQQQEQSDKKKTALTKESEYGVAGIKTPLLEVAIKAEEVWGPALGGREKEETLKAVMTALDQHKEIFRLSGTLYEAIKRNDYDGVIEAWKLARQFADKARRIAREGSTDSKGGEKPLSDHAVQQIIVTARMWHDVTAQLDEFKVEIWKRLKTSHGRKYSAAAAAAAAATGTSTGNGTLMMADVAEKEQHMELIGLLLQLGVDENPIWEWINSRYLYLKEKIARSFERNRIEIEIQRRKLTHNTINGNAKTETHSNIALAKHLRAATNVPGTLVFNRNTAGSEISNIANSNNAASGKDAPLPRDMDSPSIIAFWETVQVALSALLSSSTGVLGEVIEWWETAQAFITGQAQKAFPVGVFAAGLEHLQLDPDHIHHIRTGAVQLVNMIREAVHVFFGDAPVDDLTQLYSPMPTTPLSAPGSSTRSPISATGKRGFPFFDPATVPPPVSKPDGTKDKFAFWAPGSNSLSSSHYLSRYLALVGTAAGEMASLEVIKSPPGPTSSGSSSSTASTNPLESLKTLVTLVRERCIAALCAVWLADAERAPRALESWHRSPDRRDLTLMPGAFEAWMERVLTNVQKLAYVVVDPAAGNGGAASGAATQKSVAGAGAVTTPPPAKLLGAVRGAFVTGLYKGLSAMVENAESGGKAGARKTPKRQGSNSTDAKGSEQAEANGAAEEEEEEQSVVVKRHDLGVNAALRGLVLGGGAFSAAPTTNREEQLLTTTSGMLMEAVNGNIKSVRLLLTLSNFAHLRTVAIPHLIVHFETLFSVKLTDESKTLRDVLSQIDARLFQSYTNPTDAKLKTIITTGITSPTWSAGAAEGSTYKPKDVKPYIYSTLLALVLVHAEITNTLPPTTSISSSSSSSTTTTTTQPTPLIHQILSHHLLQASKLLLSTFRTRTHFTLSDLIQATLDVEFFSQTLNAYTSDAASTAQSELYLAMDEKTDHNARTALQAELAEMRVVLKKLKEGTKGEFACFRVRGSGAGGASGERQGRGRERTGHGSSASGTAR